jgi:transcriptional regulator with XRE-family HTH domain
MPEKQDFAKWIAETRTKRGWTTGDLADRCGLSSNTIWQYESHKREQRPDPDVLARIAKALNYPPEVLLKLAGIPIDLFTQEDELFGHVTYMLKELSPEDQGKAIDFLEYLVAKRDRTMKHKL